MSLPKLLRALVYIAAGLTFFSVAFIILYILVQGIPHLTPSLFALEYTTENVSLFPAIVNTIIIVLLTLVIAVPAGIFAAIYLVEYAKKAIA